MAIPTLTPSSTTNKSILPISGTYENVVGTLPYGIYENSEEFINGAVDQVAYTFKKLGGDVLDIELTEGNVYAVYEEAVLEYSYLVNIHQAKNSLGNLLGATTASFDEDGEITSGPKDVNLNYPRFTFRYSQRVGDGLATEAALGTDQTVYSASFLATASVQDYDLQNIISGSIKGGDVVLDSVDSGSWRDDPFQKLTIRKVYYVTGRAMWRFFAFYGGLNTIGNLSSYGQYADDSTFEILPTWQNKQQAINYEDSIRTRISHWSYELHNNKLRIFPRPAGFADEKFWVKFTIERDPWQEYSDRKKGGKGINNMNTLPFANIPYNKINSIGKQWIRRFCLALTKEILGQIRGKFGGIPIPGETVTLNASDLLGQAKAEQEALRTELKTTLDELTYAKLTEQDAKLAEDASKTLAFTGYPIYTG
jgi:hypothetical protein